jgi:hypothetical protein
VRHAVVEMGAQFRMLYLRLKDTPGTHDQRSFEPFQLFLSAVEATADRFEAVAGYRNRNRVELRSALVFPAEQYLQLPPGVWLLGRARVGSAPFFVGTSVAQQGRGAAATPNREPVRPVVVPSGIRPPPPGGRTPR